MFRRLIALGLCLGALSACIEPQRSDAELAAVAREDVWPVGFPDVRIWGDGAGRSAREQALVNASIRQGQPFIDDRLDILAISGGGADGAYGAGFLNGWTARGDRPQFDIVTGISTGAIIAPFAFLGPDYDVNLVTFYTRTRTRDVVRTSVLPAILGGTASIGDTTPLRDRIARELDDQVVARIAEEHGRGRRLFIGTTNLDAERPMIWDIGAIAASGRPGSADLIRDVVRASAAIPVAFAPVYFEVTDGNDRFTELHVDGAVTRQLFVYPIDIDVSGLTARAPRQRNFWLIHNGLLSPKSEPVTPRTIEIAGRSLSALFKSKTQGDLTRIARIAERDRFGFHLTTVPGSFDVTPQERFDPVYMTQLYNLGLRQAVSADPWFRSVEAADAAEARARSAGAP